MDFGYPFEVPPAEGGAGRQLDEFDELLCVANTLELGREVCVVLKAMAEDDSLELHPTFGFLAVVAEGEDPEYCPVIDGHHHYFTLLLDYVDGPSEVVVVPNDIEFSGRLISAVRSRVGRRVLAILGPPEPGPWGDSDGTVLAVVVPGDQRGIVYDVTTSHVVLMATDRWRVWMQLVRPSWATRQFLA